MPAVNLIFVRKPSAALANDALRCDMSFEIIFLGVGRRGIFVALGNGDRGAPRIRSTKKPLALLLATS
jgi:hypothetical protein